MKQIIFSIAVVLTSIVANGQANTQTRQVNYEAANWRTWLLDSASSIKVAAPPTAVQSKVELQTIKQRISSLNEKELAAIKYWDAGHLLTDGTRL